MTSILPFKLNVDVLSHVTTPGGLLACLAGGGKNVTIITFRATQTHGLVGL